MADRIKGITIEIDGNTTKLMDSLKKTNSSIKDTQAQLKDVNKLLKLDPKNTELLKQKQDLLGKSISLAKDKLKEEENALKQLQASGNQGKNVEQMNALKREIESTKIEIDKMTKSLGQDFPTKLSNVSKKAGALANKTKGLSIAAAGAGAGMLAMASKSALAADDLNTLSRNTGFSVEELQKMQYASGLIDVSMESMTGSIQKMTKQMSSGNKAFKKLGVNITDSNGHMRNAKDVWYESLDALSKVKNETERDALSMELFGKSAMDMSGIVDDGGKALKKLGGEAEKSGLILSGKALQDANQFNDGMDKLKATASKSFIKAGATLAKQLVPALEKLIKIVSDVLTWFANLDGGTQVFILTVLGLVAAISPIFGMISAITGAAAALEMTALPFIGLIGGIVLGIAALVAIGFALYKNWDTIKAKAGEVWNGVKNLAVGAWDGIKSAWDGIGSFFSGIFNGVASTVSSVWNGIKNTIGGVVNSIRGFFNFKWSWPKIPLPHFRIENGSLNPVDWIKNGMPRLKVDWYSKAMNNPILMSGATIFGMRGNTLLGGGERGNEVVMSEAKMREIAGGVTFVQNIQSPKQLDRLEIYRQTRNQLNQFRRVKR